MVKAYIMVVTAAGTTHEILPEIKAIKGITEADAVAGDYDLIIQIEADDASDLLPKITAQLQEVQGVQTTKTYVKISD